MVKLDTLVFFNMEDLGIILKLKAIAMLKSYIDTNVQIAIKIPIYFSYF